MRINPQLNLVQTVETDAGRCYIHSTPISRQVWEHYHFIIAKTYAAIMSEGLNVVAGPPIAMMMLREVAISMNRWEGPQGVQQGLVEEIHRLTNVVMPTEAGGWSMVPYAHALAQSAIDEDTLADLEGGLIFFTCASAMLRSPASRSKLTILMGAMESVWGARTTSLDATAFAASLETSTSPKTSAPPRASSIPH